MPLTVDIQSEQLAEYSGFIAWLHLVDKASGFEHEFKLTMWREKGEEDYVTTDPIFADFVGFDPRFLIMRLGDKEQQVNLYENFHSSELKSTWQITEILDLVKITGDVKEKLMSISLKMCLKRTYLIGKEQNYCWSVRGNEYDDDGNDTGEEYRWE